MTNRHDRIWLECLRFWRDIHSPVSSAVLISILEINVKANRTTTLRLKKFLKYLQLGRPAMKRRNFGANYSINVSRLLSSMNSPNRNGYVFSQELLDKFRRNFPEVVQGMATIVQEHRGHEPYVPIPEGWSIAAKIPTGGYPIGDFSRLSELAGTSAGKSMGFAHLVLKSKPEGV